MSKPLISVVIPVYNQERYIENTLESVLGQQGVDLEVVVVNDGSTDRSAELIKKYARRIVLIEQQNKGVAEARNAGVRAARSDLVAFLDGDDRYLPGHLSRAVKFSDEHPQNILFYGDVSVIDANGKKLWVQRSEQNSNFEKLIVNNFITTSSVFLRKNIFLDGEWFRPYQIAEDWDFWLRAINHGNFMHYPWLGMQYRKHQESLIQSKVFLAEECSLNVLHEAIKTHPELKQGLKNQAIFKVYHANTLRFLASGLNSEARKRAMAALRQFPLQTEAWMLLAASILPAPSLKIAKNIRKKIREWLA